MNSRHSASITRVGVCRFCSNAFACIFQMLEHLVSKLATINQLQLASSCSQWDITLTAEKLVKYADWLIFRRLTGGCYPDELVILSAHKVAFTFFICICVVWLIASLKLNVQCKCQQLLVPQHATWCCFRLAMFSRIQSCQKPSILWYACKGRPLNKACFVYIVLINSISDLCELIQVNKFCYINSTSQYDL